MVRPFDAYVLEGDTPTSTGTQDFTVPGVGGTPIACVVIATRNTSANTQQDNLSACWGVTDGTTTYASSNHSRHGVGTSDSVGSGSTDLIRILNPDDDSEDVVGEFDSFITNGVRIDFTTVDTSQYKFAVMLIFGTDTEVFVFRANPPGTVDTSVTVTPGFEADFVLCAEQRIADGSINGQGYFGYGIVANDGTDQNSAAILISGSSKTTQQTRRVNYNSRVAINTRLNVAGVTPDLFGGSTTIENFTSTQFEVFTRLVGSAAPDICGLAVKLPSGLDWTLETDQDFETALGSSTRSGLGFLPGTWYVAHTANAVSDQFTNFGAAALGMCDFRFEQRAISVCDQHNVGTTNTSCGFSNRDVHFLFGNNGNSLELGEITSRDDGEYTLDIDDITGNERQYHILIIEESAFEAETVVDLPAMNADLEAELQLDATIDVGLSSVAAEIEAEALFDASIGAALGAMAVNLEAELQLDASIDVGLPSMDADLDAEVQIDATITVGLPVVGAALVAETFFDAAITAGFPAQSVELEAELDQDVDAVITAALAAMAVDIEASSLVEGTITTGLPAADADLDAETVYDGAIDVGLPAVDADLDADISNDAVIAAGLASVDADLVAELRLDAVINVGLPAISAELRDFLILGCDTELLGTKEQVVDLLGTSDVETALLGTSDVETDLAGTSDTTVDLTGTSDTMVDLEGEHC